MYLKRQNAFFIFCILFLLLTYNILIHPKDNIEKTWKFISKEKVNADVSLTWVLGNNKIFTASLNGGCRYKTKYSRWKDGDIPRVFLSIIDFVDDKIGFLAGGDGRNLITKDGGKNWTLIQSEEKLFYNPKSISFISENTGWICYIKKLYDTKNGGKNWTEIQLPADCKNILAISLLSEKTGYILDDELNIFKTGDNGKDWLRIPIKISADNLRLESEPHKSAFRFFNENDGEILLWQSGQNESWISIITNDGGKTWSKKMFKSEKGFVYLTHDGKYLSILDLSNNISIYQKK